MTWCYRPVLHTDGTVSLREVFSDKNGKVGMYTEDPLTLDSYENIEDLRNTLALMLVGAILKEPVREEDLPAEVLK